MAMDEFQEKIFRQELPSLRSIVLSVSNNGAVKIDAQDMGKTL